MISTSEFHNGLVFEDEGQIWEIVSYQHHRKSQAAAVYRTVLRSLSSGNVVFSNLYRIISSVTGFVMCRRYTMTGYGILTAVMRSP